MVIWLGGFPSFQQSQSEDEAAEEGGVMEWFGEDGPPRFGLTKGIGASAGDGGLTASAISEPVSGWRNLRTDPA